MDALLGRDGVYLGGVGYEIRHSVRVNPKGLMKYIVI